MTLNHGKLDLYGSLWFTECASVEFSPFTYISRRIWGHIPDLAIFVYEYLGENSRWIWKIFFGARAWPAEGENCTRDLVM